MFFFTAPNPNITGTTVLCSGQNGTLTVNGAPTYTYAWSTGANTSTITISSPGTYSVTVTSSSGCTGADTVVVTQGTSVNPIITAPPFTTFLWSTGPTRPASPSTAREPIPLPLLPQWLYIHGSVTVNSSNPSTTLNGNTTPVTSCTSPNGPLI
ncbi:MAG: hypothetical protein IPJ40_16530 [Saprospirales bacterium]|nr:hypothetical protein [Saprospirales bacterium]